MEKQPPRIDVRLSSAQQGSLLTLSLSALFSCAPVVQVHSAGAVQHETSAAQEEQAAAEHAGQYRPDAIKAACSGQTDRPSGLICWTSSSNPTAEHLREAERHRALAATHRAASSALRAVEASACVGVTASDRDLSPFAHPEDILRVEPSLVPGGTRSPPRQVGVSVTFRAVPGLTSEWLQRLVDCHVARNAVLGHDLPQMSYCPLAVRGVTAHVQADGGGYAVTVRSDEQESINAIRQRAEAILHARR